jgi:hypothetical protein
VDLASPTTGVVVCAIVIFLLSVDGSPYVHNITATGGKAHRAEDPIPLRTLVVQVLPTKQRLRGSLAPVSLLIHPSAWKGYSRK